MHLSDEALAAFRAIWQEENPGRKISDEALRDMAVRVLRAVDAVCRPIPLYSTLAAETTMGGDTRPDAA